MSEYYGRTSNSRSCYSNLPNYGAKGYFRPIIAPTPVTTQPQIFNYIQPSNKQSNCSTKQFGCSPYVNVLKHDYCFSTYNNRKC